MANDVKLFGMPAESGRWVMVIVGMIIQLCLGAIYAYGVVRVPLTAYFKTLGLTPTAMDMTWPFIVFLLFFALTMPLVGPYIQKMGPKKVGMVGGALCGLAWFLASYAPSPLMLIPLYSVIGGLGVGIAYGCPIAVSAQWFPDKRGLAVGLTVLGFGFSAFVIAQTNAFLMANYGGIANSLKIFGVAFLPITVVLSQLLMFPPAGWKPAGWTPPAPKPGAAAKLDFMRSEMTKTTYIHWTMALLLHRSIGWTHGHWNTWASRPGCGKKCRNGCTIHNCFNYHSNFALCSSQWAGSADIRHSD